MSRKQSLFVRNGLLALFVLIAMLWFACPAFAAGPTEYVIYSFPANASGGIGPIGSLVADSAGNLYGTAYGGGAFGDGDVYELLRPVPPSTKWTQTVLYSFTGGSDGQAPIGGVIFDQAGNLYGTAEFGGDSAGVVFELVPPATPGGQWSESVLHTFYGLPDGDGIYPRSGLVFDSSGNLYGTTAAGGERLNANCGAGCGTVFQLHPPATQGAAWTETVIHYFNFGRGTYPQGTPIFDSKGYLYGTTYGGGLHSGGVTYRLAPPATEGGAWTYKVLYAFRATATDGYTLNAGLTLHGRDVLYGTTFYGGQYGFGTVFQLVPPAVAGGAWTENILYNFAAQSDGASPAANVIFDKAGNLFGTTWYGGGNGSGICINGGCGTVFDLSPPATEGGNWTETVLHSFPASAKDGSSPDGGVIFGKNGVLFGVTGMGGAGNQGGAVFGLIP